MGGKGDNSKSTLAIFQDGNRFNQGPTVMIRAFPWSNFIFGGIGFTLGICPKKPFPIFRIDDMFLDKCPNLAANVEIGLILGDFPSI